MQKRILTASLLMVLIICLAATPVDAASYKLIVNGEEIALTQEIKLINKRSMLPIRDFFQSVGAHVDWDGSARTAVVKKDNIVAYFPVNSRYVRVNGIPVATDTPTQLTGNLVYIPIRIAGEVLGYDVDYRNGTIIMTEDLAAQNARRHYATFSNIFERALKGERVFDELEKECFSLLDALIELDKRAFVSPRGYTLYAPEDAYEYDLLWQAMIANAWLYHDLLKDNVRQDINLYYGEHPTVPSVGKLRNWVRLKPAAYDHEAVIDTLENLPVPDILLRGTKIFMLPGASPSAAGVNVGSFDRGSGSVVFVGGNRTMDDIIGTLHHEIGHSIENILSTNMPDFEEAYAKLYGRTAPTDLAAEYEKEWGDRLTENFAEDFVYYCLGIPKQSSWTGVSEERFAEFLRNQIDSFTPTSLSYTRIDLTLPDGRKMRLDCPLATFVFVMLPAEECVIEIEELTLKLSQFYANQGIFPFEGNKARFKPGLGTGLSIIRCNGQQSEMHFTMIGVDR